MVVRRGSADESDDAAVVAPAYNRNALSELGHLDFAAERALENDGAFALESAAPGAGGGGGSVIFSKEVVGGRADELREVK